MKKSIYLMNIFGCLLLGLATMGCNSDEDLTPVPEKPVEATDGGYLFAHMTDDNYGSLFYSVSRDAYNWETLNDGRTFFRPIAAIPTSAKGATATI